MPNEQHMISPWDTRNNENLALPYHSNSQNQHRFGPKNNNNNSRKNYNYQRSFRSESCTRPALQEQLCDSGDIQTVDSKTHNSVLETQRCPLTVFQKSNKPNSLLKETEPPLPSDSRKSDEIINLGITKRSENPIVLTQSKTQQLKPKKPLNWDEEITDSINELEQLMSNEPRSWQKPFPLKNETIVTITYFIESPTATCYVVQNQYKTKMTYLHDDMKRLHSSIVDTIKIITNEVYCVQYEDNYYRCVCLYQINSKEVLVRLIDMGLTFQTQISAIKYLDPRFKTLHAFAFEINFETSLNVTVGQTLNIYSFSVDATGTINVKLGQEEKNNQIELVPLPTGIPMELFCLDYNKIDLGYISACIHDAKKIESINQLSDKIKNYLKMLGEAGKYFPKLDEVCFVYHDCEHQWYRAECIKVINSDSFEVLFIDYGNTRIVNSTNIRKFVSEFAEPAIMHFCCISGKF